jgi:hypothetical protein
MATIIVAKCPVPRCEHKNFQGASLREAKDLVREHLKANLEDPIHSDIAELEGWFDPDPLGD